MKINKSTLAALIVTIPVLSAQQAQAGLAIMENWGIDLTGLNGSVGGAATYNGLGTLTGLQDITVSGQSTVTQNLDGVGGSAVGQSFTEEGYLNWVGARNDDGTSVGAGTWANFLGSNNVSTDNFIYFEWQDLTGTVSNALGDIVFDTPQVGKVSLFLDSASGSLAGLGDPGNRFKLADFDVVPLSGGSGIGVDGGAFPSGTVGLTLDVTSLIAGVSFLDSLGNIVGEDVLFNFVDVDATIATSATFFTGLDGAGDETTPGGALSFVQSPINHDGSIVPAQEVPEPGLLALLALGLVTMGSAVRNRKRLS